MHGCMDAVGVKMASRWLRKKLAFTLPFHSGYVPITFRSYHVLHSLLISSLKICNPLCSLQYAVPEDASPSKRRPRTPEEYQVTHLAHTTLTAHSGEPNNRQHPLIVSSSTLSSFISPSSPEPDGPRNPQATIDWLQHALVSNETREALPACGAICIRSGPRRSSASPQRWCCTPARSRAWCEHLPG